MIQKKRVLLVRAASPLDVRLRKFRRVFEDKGWETQFVGWKRVDEEFERGDVALLAGYGYSNWMLIFGYFIWFFRLGFYLRSNWRSFDFVYLADFECAFPAVAFGVARRVACVYDIYDEVSLRYQRFARLSRILGLLDSGVRERVRLVLHVDESRVGSSGKRCAIVRNMPFDFFSGRWAWVERSRSVAVTGWLTQSRGVPSVYAFARDCPDIEFRVIGVIPDAFWAAKLGALGNVRVFPYMPQEGVFERIRDCSAIFALYDPAVPINVLAASNKVYDALMLGTPLVANFGTPPADLVRDVGCGIVLPYHYGAEWGVLARAIRTGCGLRSMGEAGRRRFERLPSFAEAVDAAFSSHGISLGD